MNPEPIFRALLGYRAAAVVRAAIELDCFTAVAEGASTAASIARRLGGTERSVRILLDAVAVAVPEIAAGRVAASVRTQLAARARQRGGVLLPFGDWDGADITLSPEKSLWYGLGKGQGRLRRRELTVCARGRGAAARPRRATFWLPGPPPAETPQPQASPKRHLALVQ